MQEQKKVKIKKKNEGPSILVSVNWQVRLDSKMARELAETNKQGK